MLYGKSLRMVRPIAKPRHDKMEKVGGDLPDKSYSYLTNLETPQTVELSRGFGVEGVGVWGGWGVGVGVWGCGVWGVGGGRATLRSLGCGVQGFGLRVQGLAGGQRDLLTALTVLTALTGSRLGRRTTRP